MNIREFSNNLQKIYTEMANTFSEHQNRVNLPCLSGCGRCCLNPDVEASMLEMIPFALKIYDEGKLEEWMDKLTNSKQEHCLLYLPGDKEGEGKCGHYLERASICRMFGAAGYYNKHHQAELSVCKYIKEKHPGPYQIENPPMLADWSQQMSQLDPDLIKNRMPINRAILQALEKIAFYAQYQTI